MTSREFCYWLQGYFELSGTGTVATKPIAAAEADLIKRHLSLVFLHEIDPSAGPPEAQKKLNEAHGNMGGTPRC